MRVSEESEGSEVFYKVIAVPFIYSGTLKNDIKASKSPNPSLTSLIVRKFKINGVKTPNYILIFSEVLYCVSSLVKSFFTSFFTNGVVTPFF